MICLKSARAVLHYFFGGRRKQRVAMDRKTLQKNIRLLCKMTKQNIPED